MNEIRYPFNPQMGSEKAVLSQDPKTGFIYFTTGVVNLLIPFPYFTCTFPLPASYEFVLHIYESVSVLL